MKSLNFQIRVDKALGIYLPFIVFLAIAANAVLIRFGLSYVYAVIMLVGIAAMIVTGIQLPAAVDKAFLLIYFITILLMVAAHAVLLEGRKVVASATLIYIFVPFYWFVYFCKYDYRHLNEVIRLSIPVVFVIALLGVLQYFFSPTLFGLIDVQSNALEWASSTTFDVYSAFFRASSTLGSPQVYGLFIGLSIVLIDSRCRKKGMLFWGGMLFLAVAGFLSGNKTFVAVLLIYFAMRVLSDRRRVALKVVYGLALIGLLYSGLSRYVEYVPMLERVISLEQALEQEEDDSRIGKYRFIFLNTDPLIGNGIGTLTKSSVDGIKAAESYILKLYYEGGAVVALMFVSLMYWAYRNSCRSRILGAKELIVLIFFSMIVVHAFDSPAYFLFWGIIISTFGAATGTTACEPLPVMVREVEHL